MMKIELLNVKYHARMVGRLSLTPDNKLCAFEYAPYWLTDGFSISPLELPLRQGSWKWHLAPAYDLTLCTEGYNGEHATSVNGTGHPTLKDFIAVGAKIKMNEQRCREIIEEVRSGCGDIARYHISPAFTL